MSHSISLGATETSIAQSLARSDNDSWHCNLCQNYFEDVVPAVIHVMEECPMSPIAGPESTAPVSSIVKICAYLDPQGCTPMLQSYQRVKAENTGDFGAEATVGDYSNLVWAQIQGPPGVPGGEADDDEDEEMAEGSEGVDEPGSSRYETYAEEPPTTLTEAEKRRWRQYQVQSTRIRDIMEANRYPQDSSNRQPAVNTEAALRAWNRTYGWMQGHHKYGKFPAMASRLTRDRKFLRDLLEKSREL